MTNFTTEIFCQPFESRLKKEIHEIVDKYEHNLFEPTVHALVDDIYEHLHNFVRMSDLMNYENNNE